VNYIRFNKSEEWDGKIYTIKTKEDFDFLEHPVKIEFDENILSKIKIDLRPKITIAHGLKVGGADTIIEEPVEIPDNYFELLNWDSIYSDIMNYKITKGMFNLLIDIQNLKQIILSKKYKIFVAEISGLKIENNGSKPILRVTSFDGIKKLYDLIWMVLKDYIQKFYRREEKRKTMDYLEVEPLTKEHSVMLPEDNEIVIKIPRRLTNDIAEVIKHLGEYNPDNGNLPEEWKKWDSFIVHLNNYLYTPLIIWKKTKRKPNQSLMRLIYKGSRKEG